MFFLLQIATADLNEPARGPDTEDQKIVETSGASPEKSACGASWYALAQVIAAKLGASSIAMDDDYDSEP